MIEKPPTISSRYSRHRFFRTLHCLHDLLIRFTMSKHNGTFRDQRWFGPLSVAENFQRLFVASPRISNKSAKYMMSHSTWQRTELLDPSYSKEFFLKKRKFCTALYENVRCSRSNGTTWHEKPLDCGLSTDSSTTKGTIRWWLEGVKFNPTELHQTRSLNPTSVAFTNFSPLLSEFSVCSYSSTIEEEWEAQTQTINTMANRQFFGSTVPFSSKLNHHQTNHAKIGLQVSQTMHDAVQSYRQLIEHTFLCTDKQIKGMCLVAREGGYSMSSVLISI